jgi:hypothetical protein
VHPSPYAPIIMPNEDSYARYSTATAFSAARSSLSTDLESDFSHTVDPPSRYTSRPCTADTEVESHRTPRPSASKGSISSVPSYKPSSEPPYYTHEPTSTEQVLAANSPFLRNPGRTTTLIKTASSSGADFALHLFGQSEGSTLPSYGKNARIVGDVVFGKGMKHVKEVIVKVRPASI